MIQKDHHHTSKILVKCGRYNTDLNVSVIPEVKDSIDNSYVEQTYHTVTETHMMYFVGMI